MMFWKRLLYRFCVVCRPNRSRTIQYAFPLVFVAAAFLGAAALLFEDSSYIRIEASTAEVAAGERFEIDVYAGAHVPVNAVDVTLTFPPDKVKVLGIDTGESVITLWTQQPYVENNQVILRGGTFRKGFLDEHLIATINAEAIKSGKALFSATEITLLAGDGTGKKVKITKSGKESLAVRVINNEGALDSNIELLIATDIDGDGDVGLDDVQAFMKAWSSQNILYDFNNDRKMTFVDFAIILADSFFR